LLKCFIISLYLSFQDNQLITIKSTKKVPLSETERMKRVNNYLIDLGVISRLSTQGLWKWPTSTAKFLEEKKLRYVPLDITIPKEIEAKLIKTRNKRGGASFNTLIIVEWLYNLQLLQENAVTLDKLNQSKSRLNVLESDIGVRTAVRPVIKIDWDILYRKLRNKGIINRKNNPGSLPDLKAASNYQIIEYFNALAHGFLSSFRCADDFGKLKRWVNWYIRYSLISTLQDKLKLGSRSRVIDRFGIDISTVDSKGNMSLIHIWRFRLLRECRSRWATYH
jgi:hypothetical protein